MTQDIAGLGIAVDTTQVRRAREDLQGLREASMGAADANTRFGDSARQLNTNASETARTLDLTTASLRQQNSALEMLIERVNTYGRAMEGLKGPMAQMVEASNRLEVAGRAFNAGAAGMENFSRASRQVGLDAAETVQALQRIQAALAGVSAEGLAARRVLSEYGVTTAGRGPSEADRVLAEFTQRTRAYRSDSRTMSDIQTVLGPVTLDTATTLAFPDTMTSEQRRRQAANTEAERAATITRDSALRGIREAERRRKELEDLEKEFGAEASGGGGTPEQRRQQLLSVRASGVLGASDPARQANSWSPTVQAGRQQTWMNDPRYAANLQEIEARRLDEAQTQGGFMPWARSVGRTIGNFFRAYTPTNQFGVPGEVNERTTGFGDETQALYGFRTTLSATERQQQQQLMQWGQGWNIDTSRFAVRSPTDALRDFLPGQRQAIVERWGMMDRAQNRFGQERATDEQRVRDAYEGASGAGPLAASRAAQAVEAEIKVREQYVTDAGREAALQRELGEIVAREKDARTRATTALQTEANITQAGANAMATAMRGGQGGYEALAAGQLAQWGTASVLLPGQASPSARADQAFASASLAVQQRTAQGAVDTARNRDLANLDLSSMGAPGYAEQRRELEQHRDLVDTIVRAELQRGKSLQEALATAKEMTRELRDQATETALLQARQVSADLRTETAGSAIDTARRSVQTPFERQGNDFYGRWAGQNYAEQLQDFPNTFAGQAARMRRARELLEADPAGQAEADRAYGIYVGPGRQDAASRASGRIGTARIGIGGSPADARGAAAARTRYLGGNGFMDPVQAQDEALAQDAEAGAQLEGSTNRLLYGSRQSGLTSLRLSREMRDARLRPGDLWSVDTTRQVLGEVSGGALDPGRRDERYRSLVMERTAAGTLGAERSSVNMRQEAEDLRAQADAARVSGQALTDLRRIQEDARATQELLSQARTADRQAQIAAAQGNVEEAQRLREVAQAAREAAAGYEEEAKGKRAAGDAAGVAGERRSMNERISDLNLENNGGWLRSNASVQRDVAMQRYGREIDTRYGSNLSASDREDLVKQAGEVARLEEVARTNRQVRDSFQQVGTAAGSALEQIILRGANAKQVMAGLAAEMASMALRAATRPLMSAAGDWLFKGVSSVVGGWMGGGSLPPGGAVNPATNFYPYATGGAFDRGNLVPMASGGIVDSATFRPMANGSTAMMGEAGPEAVLPLARLPSGNLGVRSGGGGGVFAPNVTINMNGGGGGGGGGVSHEQAQLVAAEVQKAIKEAWAAEAHDQMRIGGALNPIFGR